MKLNSAIKAKAHLVYESFAVNLIAVCHDLDVIALSHKGWEILGSIVLSLDPPVVLQTLYNSTQSQMVRPIMILATA